MTTTEVLAGFDASTGTFLEVAVTDALRELGKSGFAAQEERDYWWAESAAFNFTRGANGEESVWGTAFGPLITATKDDRTSFYAPEIKEADAGTIEHWKRRSTEARHPILRARYADLVWDFSRLVAKEKPDVSFARAAIDTYIEATKLSYKVAAQPSGYAERALELAIMIEDDERIGRAVEAMLALYDRVARPEHAGSWPFLADALLENKKVNLSEAQHTRIIQSLEDILRRAADHSNPAEFSPWSAQGAAERLVVVYRKAEAMDEVHRVFRTYGTAFEKLAENASPTLALAWLQPVYEAYRSAGMRDDAQRVHLVCEEKGKRAHEDMKQVSASVEISTEERENFLAAITADSLELSYKRIAGRFITKASKARDFLKEMMHQAPLQAMIGVQKIGDGHIVAQAGSVEADPEDRVIMHLAQMIEIETPFLSWALDKTHERYSPSATVVCDFLGESPLFPSEERDLLMEGIEAHLNGDCVKAVHILLPQIEVATRRLLGLLGLPTSKPMRSSKGVMQAKNLNDTLGDPNIEAVLGNDMTLYLRTLLNDPRGHNVRNRVLHGLAGKQYLSKPLSDRVFHVLLALSLIRKKGNEGQTN